jgi:hypothetical protein
MIRIGKSQSRKTPPVQIKAKPMVTMGSRAIAPATISKITNRLDRVFILISFVQRQNVWATLLLCAFSTLFWILETK